MNLIRYIYRYILKNRIEALVILISGIIGYSLIHLGTFTDEADYILGGCLISEGKVIYKDFFAHHLPVPFYFSAFLSSLFGCKIYLARYIVVLLQIIAFWLSYKVSKNIFVLLFLPVYLLLSPFYYAHYFISEVFISIGFMLLAPLIFYPDRLKGMAFLLMYTVGLAFIVNANQIGIVIGLLVFLYFFITYKSFRIKILIASFLTIVPTLLILLLQNNFKEFIELGVLFNVNIYSKYLKGTMTNPVDIILSLVMYIRDRFILITDALFTDNKLLGYSFFAYLLESILFLSFFYYIFKGKLSILLKGILVVILVLSIIRYENDPFHILPYVFLSLFILAEVLKTEKKSFVIKIVVTLVFILAIRVYFGALPADLKNPPNYQLKVQDPYILQHTSPGDSILVYPYDPISYITTARKPGSFHYFFLPWQADINGSQEKVIADIERNNVKLVYFSPYDDIRGKRVENYSDKIYEYLKKNYETIRLPEGTPGLIFIKK